MKKYIVQLKNIGSTQRKIQSWNMPSSEDNFYSHVTTQSSSMLFNDLWCMDCCNNDDNDDHNNPNNTNDNANYR